MGRLTPRPSIEGLECRRLLSAVPDLLRINAGGGEYVDSLQRIFQADSGFAGGTAGVSAAGVANTEDDALFASYRTGPQFAFSHALANGNYALWLEFADPSATAAGERVFDVTAEGQTVVDDLDLFAEAGPATALAKFANVRVSDGILDLQFTASVGEAVVSAIVVVPTDIPEVALPYSSVTSDETAQRVKSASNLRRIYFELQFYTYSHKGSYPPDLAVLFDDAAAGYEIFACPRTDTALPRAELSRAEQRAWVAQQQDYVYVGAGTRAGSVPPDAPLAYENPERVAGPLNILFHDGHVGLLERTEAAALLGFTTPGPEQPPTWPTPGPAEGRTVQSMLNLRAISSAANTYAMEHRGYYPATPGELWATSSSLSPETFLNPRSTTPPPPAGLTNEQIEAWINATTDYTWLANNRNGTNTLIAYETPNALSGGINLAFSSDGHVEFREMRWALETLARTFSGPAKAMPLADLGGPQNVVEGQSVVLAGVGVPTQRLGVISPITAYQWDVDYDGVSFDADLTGREPVFSAASLAGPQMRTLALRVVDSAGQVSPIATTTLLITDATPPTLLSAVSRKAHGAGGDFDLPLSLTTSTIEPRLNGPTQLVFSFSEPIVAQDGLLDASEFVLSPNVTFASASLSGSTLTLNLSNLSDGQVVTVQLQGLKDTAGYAMAGDVDLSVGVLLGDVNGNATVNINDVNLVKSRSGAVVDATTFRYDLNANGSININDVNLVKSRSGNNLSSTAALSPAVAPRPARSVLSPTVVSPFSSAGLLSRSLWLGAAGSGNTDWLNLRPAKVNLLQELM